MPPMATNVIVQGSFSVRPEDRDQFIERSIGGMRSSRREDGCLEYVLAADPLDPGRVVISERWESREHLDRHLLGMANLTGEAAEDRAARPAPLTTEITVFEVAGSAKLV